jgi:hypothetical protein
MNQVQAVRVAGSRAVRAIGVLVVLLGLVLASMPALGADPGPSPSPALADLRMTVRPMLGGTVRPGAWAAVRVHVENDGPAVTGELRVTGGQGGDSRYGVAVQLPTGARQEHLLFAQPAWFGSRLSVSLVADGEALLSRPLTTRSVDAWTPTIVVVAERPEGIVSDVRAGATAPSYNPPVILTVDPEELPPRVEAWSAIDRLVWQDVDTSRLSEEQLAAMRAWVGAGGRLIVVGGSTGTSTLGAFPEDLLPFQPSLTVDASTEDLAGLLGPLPAGATPLPVVSGLLDEGTVLGRSADHVFAAQRGVGQGSVTLVGFDPSASWLRGTPTATALWRRLLPTSNGAVINPLALQDDSAIVSSLGNLPAVDLPDIGVLFALLLLYIALIGPVNYLVLRRLDRREWAWVTMPVLVAIFAVAAWGLGVGLKGTDTIVNQVGIVRTATGTDLGIGQYYVGVFSPTRATYQVNVADAALLTNPMYLQQQGQTTTPLDVLLGETSTLRDFQVGFAVLRVFRAEAVVPVPHLDADLVYRDGVLGGTIINRSDRTLSDVAVTWGGVVQVIDTLPAGSSADVALRVAATRNLGTPLSELIFGPYPSDGRGSRTDMTRRSIIDQVTYYSNSLAGAGSVQQGPVILAWATGPGIGVDLGAPTKEVGEVLHLYPAPVAVSGPTVWTASLIGHSIMTSSANDASDQGSQLSLSRGTMVVELRPLGFGGPFMTTALSMMLTQGDQRPLTGTANELAPLPPDEQPLQDDPLVAVAPDASTAPDATTDAPVAGGVGIVAEPAVKPGFAAEWDGIPDMQLFDRVSGAWVEFPHQPPNREFRIPRPERYVDSTGAILVRFVNRGAAEMTTWFTPLVRLEGIAG